MTQNSIEVKPRSLIELIPHYRNEAKRQFLRGEIVSNRKIIALSNQKGGVGKTSCTISLTAALARKGKIVLMVDGDPQGSLTEYFVENAYSLKETMYNLIIDKTPIKPLKLGDYIRLLPANVDFFEAEYKLLGRGAPGTTLARMLQADIYQSYDYVVIDCPPSLGLLTVNCLGAADRVIVPVVPELVAERTIKLLLDTVKNVQEEINPKLDIWKILPTKVDGRFKHHREVREAVGEKYAGLVYDDSVKQTVSYLNASAVRADVGAVDSRQMEFWDTLADNLIKDSEGW